MPLQKHTCISTSFSASVVSHHKVPEGRCSLSLPRLELVPVTETLPAPVAAAVSVDTAKACEAEPASNAFADAVPVNGPENPVAVKTPVVAL